MASPFTTEKDNFTRVVHLINDLGLKALQETLDHYATLKGTVHGSPRPTFNDILQNNQANLNRIKGPSKGKPITAVQWIQLFPGRGIAVKTKDLDITLCFVLLRQYNLCGLKAPITGWDKIPTPTDTSLEGSLAHLKFIRNFLAHSNSSELSNFDFSNYFPAASQAIQNISSNLPFGTFHVTAADIKGFETGPISPTIHSSIKDIILQYKQEEANVNQSMEEHHKETVDTMKKQATKMEEHHKELEEVMVLTVRSEVQLTIREEFLKKEKQEMQEKQEQDRKDREIEDLKNIIKELQSGMKELQSENENLRFGLLQKEHNPGTIRMPSKKQEIAHKSLSYGFLPNFEKTEEGSIIMTFYCLPSTKIPNIGEEIPTLSKIMTEVCITDEIREFLGKEGYRLYACVTLLDIKSVGTSRSNVSMLQYIFQHGVMEQMYKPMPKACGGECFNKQYQRNLFKWLLGVTLLENISVPIFPRQLLDYAKGQMEDLYIIYISQSIYHLLRGSTQAAKESTSLAKITIKRSSLPNASITPALLIESCLCLQEGLYDKHKAALHSLMLLMLQDTVAWRSCLKLIEMVSPIKKMLSKTLLIDLLKKKQTNIDLKVQTINQQLSNDQRHLQPSRIEPAIEEFVGLSLPVGKQPLISGLVTEGVKSHQIRDDEEEEEEEDDEDYCMKQRTLLDELVDILRQYPDNEQILKEIIQNAEDASASEVKFLLDENTYSRNKLYHPGLDKFQGAALFAYNDSTFADKDWDGIRQLQRSVKEKEPLKVGRFGLGFKSVLHMTDFPGVLSGRKLAYMDPHEKFFDFQNRKTSGKIWKYPKKKDDLKIFPDQFEPYFSQTHFGCEKSLFKDDKSEGYPATLFRFPLRQSASELSKTVYSPDSVRNLFNGFEAEAYLVPLFLRSLENIEVMECQNESHDPSLRFQVKVTNVHPDVDQRRRFNQSLDGKNWLKNPVSITYPCCIEVTKYKDNKRIESYQLTWLVNLYCAGGDMGDSKIPDLMDHHDIQQVPLVGIALPLKQLSDRDPRFRTCGHEFCFLPLPIEQQKSTSTGLPVHVNGYFAITPNRRSIRWPAGGQNLEKDIPTLWNQSLIKEVVPDAYIDMIIAARDLSMDDDAQLTLSPDDVYNGFPSISNVTDNWQILLEPLYNKLWEKEIIFSEAMGGQWVKVDQATFIGSDTPEAVIKVLTEAEVYVARVPEHVLEAINNYYPHAIDLVGVDILLDYINKFPQIYQNIKDKEKIELLTYILRKCLDYEKLVGLELLPLCSGEFVLFEDSDSCKDQVYAATAESPADLIPGHKNLFVDVPDGIQAEFDKLAESGKTQVCMLTPETLVNLLPKTLPKSWSMQDQVQWKCGQSKKEPPEEWLQLIWTYLHDNFQESLESFEPLTLLPLAQDRICITMVSLKTPTKFILDRYEDYILSDETELALEALGICVTRTENIPKYVLKHPGVINHYIFKPSPRSVLQILANTIDVQGEGHWRQTFEKLSTSIKQELRKYLAKCELMYFTKQVEEALKKLPIFESIHKVGSGQKADFVAANDVTGGLVYYGYNVNPPKQYIDLGKDDSSKILADVLKVEEVSVATFLLSDMLPAVAKGHYNKKQEEEILLFTLQMHKSLVMGNGQIAKEVGSMQFLPTKSGYKKPCELFDPCDLTLQRIFAVEDVFPGNPFDANSLREVLGHIGLKGKDNITAKNIFQACIKIEQHSKWVDNRAVIMDKAASVLEILTEDAHILTQRIDKEHTLTDHLIKLKWLPVQEKPRDTYPDIVPWFKSPAFVFRPCHIMPYEKADILGSVAPVLGIRLNDLLVSTLQIGTKFTPELIFKHLKNLNKIYTPSHKLVILKIVQKCYEALLDFDDGEEVKKAAKVHAKIPWVWHGDGFKKIQHMVLQECIPRVDLMPYVQVIPSETRSFVDLFENCGMKSKCDVKTCFKVSTMIKEKHKRGDKITPEDVSNDLRIASNIVHAILGSIETADCPELSAEMKKQLMIPTAWSTDAVLCMAAVSECTYCDREWVRKGFDPKKSYDGEDKVNYVHKEFSEDTCRELGVPSLTKRMLHVKDWPVKDFGQNRDLPAQLKNILQSYADGFALPKEMIQNADDSGATEVYFLYDERDNSAHRTCLIDPMLAECQGSALWVYNNATFSESDLHNIIDLGAGRKASESGKIGRFGLGFNVVYNVTDVPSFVTGNQFVMFDPHKKYIRNVSSDTGFRMELDGNKGFIHSFRDQFEPYNGIFDCNIFSKAKNYFDGTLFRLPLRTKRQNSLINEEPYDSRNIIEIFKLCIENAQHLLLFTQNVLKAKFFYLPRTTNDQKLKPQELFTIVKNPVKLLREIDISINLSSEPYRKLEAKMQRFVRQCNFLKACSDFQDQTYKTEPDPVMEDLKIDGLKTSTVFEIRFKVSQAGVNFLNTEEKEETYTWMVSSYMETQLRKYIGENASKLKGYLPCGAVAAQLQESENGEYIPISMENHGKVFSFLPLPVQYGLPVHINGHFAVQSDRRHLYEDCQDHLDKTYATWNKHLFESVLCKCYCLLLEDIKRILPKSLPKYHLLWPKLYSNSHIQQVKQSHPSIFIKSFYQQLSTGLRAAYFSDGKAWFTFHQLIFLHPSLRQNPVIGDLSQKVLETYEKDFAACAVDMEDFVLEAIQWAGFESVAEKKCFNIEKFFWNIVIPKLSTITKELRNPLILYALDHQEMQLQDMLIKSKCIPVTPLGETLEKPGRLIHPNAEMTCLYHATDKRFPHGKDFCKDNRLLVLESWGMKAHTYALEWEDITERAVSIGRLSIEEKNDATKRLVNLFRVMDQKLNLDSNDWDKRNANKELLRIKFLPIMPKPNSMPSDMTWGGARYDTMLSPSELYQREYAPLLCCVAPIFNDTEFNMTALVKKFFVFGKRKPSIEQVVKQLLQLCRLSLQNVPPKGKEEFYRMITAIYGFLEKISDSKNYFRPLHDKPVIFVENCFVKPAKVAVSFSTNCAPYLYRLPLEYALGYRYTMQAFGVKGVFSVTDYINALDEMKQHNGIGKLGAGDLSSAITIIQGLVNSKEGRGKRDINGTTFLPDENRVLTAVEELHYPNADWMKKNKHIKYTHPGITEQAAQILGVKMQRQQALRRYAKAMPFGQQEQLTISLARTLRYYSRDFEILKELLQNADDAGATEFKLIIDTRTHECRKVIGDEDMWKEIQGPALCVYNNAQFTQKDLDGIRNFGIGSKGKDSTKIGQYGVGFSAIYHLTDVPMFMTRGSGIGAVGESEGQVLCILDPNCLYVPEASTSEPGIKIDDMESLEEDFPDVYNVFKFEGIPMADKFTMFRFPLRTKEAAGKSQVSKESMSLKALKNIVYKFREEMMDMVLFLNNIKKIKVLEISKHHSIELDSVDVKIKDCEPYMAKDFNTAVSKAAKTLGSNDLSVLRIQPRHLTYEVDVVRSDTLSKSWLVVHSLGCPASAAFPESLKGRVGKDGIHVLPKGGVALLLKAISPSHKGQLAPPTQVYRPYCYMPLPMQTNFPVHISGHFMLGFENRRQICMERETLHAYDWNVYLLQHVIASAYVKLIEAYKYHVFENIDGSPCLLLPDSTMRSKWENYMKLFPSIPDSFWIQVQVGLYHKLYDYDGELMPIVRPVWRQDVSLKPNSQPNTSQKGKLSIEWVSLHQEDNAECIFIDDLEEHMKSTGDTVYYEYMEEAFSVSSIKDAKTTNDSDLIRGFLLRAGFNLVQLPKHLLSNLKTTLTETNCHLPSVTSEKVFRFLQSAATGGPCVVGDIPCSISNTAFASSTTLLAIIQYCRRCPNFKNVAQLPISLCADEKLRMFSNENPPFGSTYASLFPSCGEKFISNYVEHCFDVPLKDPDLEMASQMLDICFPELKTNNKRVDRVHLHARKDWFNSFWRFVDDSTRPLINAWKSTDDKRKQLQNPLTPLNEWCLMPIIEAGKSKLIALGSAKSVVCYGTQINNLPIQRMNEILRKMEMPELNTSLLKENPENEKIMKTLVTTLEHPEAVLENLSLALSKDPTVLSCQDKHILLEYISNNIDSLQRYEANKRMISSLPIFTNICGFDVSLENCVAYTLPEGMPVDEMDTWRQQKDIIFLERKSTVAELYQYLGCMDMTISELYCKLVFPQMSMEGFLSKEAKYNHLYFIFKNLEVMSMRSLQRGATIMNNAAQMEILTDLRIIPFIETESGDMLSAQDLCDPENQVFKAMLSDQDSFPPTAPGEFTKPEWHKFLIELGMQTKVTKEMYLSFARKVEAKAKYMPDDEVRTQSRILVEHLCKVTGFDEDNDNFLQDIGFINFIVSAEVSDSRCALHLPYGYTDRSPPFTSFSEAVASSAMDLIWTTRNILPEWANPMNMPLHQNDRQKLATKVGFVGQPNTYHVRNHLIKLSRHLKKYPEILQRRVKVAEEIFTHIFQYFQETLAANTGPDDNSATRDILKNLRCVLIKEQKILVKPSQILINTEGYKELLPYIYNMPAAYQEVNTFLQMIGAHQMPSFKLYADVIAKIQQKKENRKLNPNNITLVCKAVLNLFHTLEKESHHTLATDYDGTLFLPDQNGHLVASNRLVYNDAPNLRERIQDFREPVLFHLAECGIKAPSFATILERLPENIRPGFMSHIIVETLVSPAELAAGAAGTHLQARLQSEQFSHAIRRLVFHNSVRRDEARMENNLRVMKNIAVYTGNDVITQLEYNGEMVSNSQRSHNCYVKKPTIQQLNEATGGETDSHQWQLYLPSKTHLGNDILIVVAEAINELMENALGHSILYLSPLLAKTCEDSEIDAVLDNMNIRTIDDVVAVQTHDIHRIVPLVGSSLNPDDCDNLTQTFNPHQRGQQIQGMFIAYKASESHPYVYGQLLGKVWDDELQYCLVNIGNGEERIRKDNLYFFDD